MATSRFCLNLFLVISLLCGAGCFAIQAPALAEDADSADSEATDVLPRFAMLASPEVNLRTGPGKRYPIDWVIRRKGLPVEIVQQFEHWRKVRLQDGTAGWAHKVMLNNYRACVVKSDNPGGTKPQNLYAKPDTGSRVQARIEPTVLCRLQRCQLEWCEVKVQGFDGWLPKTSFWGVYKTEMFEK